MKGIVHLQLKLLALHRPSGFAVVDGMVASGSKGKK